MISEKKQNVLFIVFLLSLVCGIFYLYSDNFLYKKDTEGKRVLDNTSIVDPNNEYIINPNLEIYKKYEWATWQDSAGGRLAHDPAWFKLPAEKYIPKEVPFDWKLVKGQDALTKRNAYFSHLCKTESVGYRTPDYPKDISTYNDRATSTWFYPRMLERPIKNMDQVVGRNQEIVNEVLNIARQNPYINPGFGFRDWREGQNRRFDFFPANEEYYKRNPGRPLASTFREYMLENGDVYRISFDINTNRFVPLEKIELKDVKAQYYTIWKEIERPEMKKLGIYGAEVISFDRQNNKLIQYARLFRIPLYMDSMRGSGQHTPIDWKREYNCAVEHQTVVESLEK